MVAISRSTASPPFERAPAEAHGIVQTLWHSTATCRAGEWHARSAIDTLTLTYEDRYRRRVRLTTDGGRILLVNLPRAVALRDGDALLIHGGGAVRIRAAAEPVLDVRAPDRHQLLRVTWHLGNRHLPTELREDGLRLRQDPVIEELVRSLGCSVRRTFGAFQPEGGAYDTSHGH